MYLRSDPRRAAEYWDCAIPSYAEAENAVRAASHLPDASLISAYAPITAEVVKLTRLRDGEDKTANIWVHLTENTKIP